MNGVLVCVSSDLDDRSLGILTSVTFGDPSVAAESQHVLADIPYKKARKTKLLLKHCFFLLLYKKVK